MQKRLYITIDLPDEIKESFRKEENRWKNLRVFWTGFSNLHLTFEYLGIVDKEGLKVIKKVLSEMVEGSGPFELRLDRIVLGPDEKEPRMFWVTIFEDSFVNKFRREFRSRLSENGLEIKNKDFVPHIVLAKAKGNQLKGKKTNVHIKGKFRVDELNLYSAQTYAKGATKYKLVETFSLKK